MLQRFLPFGSCSYFSNKSTPPPVFLRRARILRWPGSRRARDAVVVAQLSRGGRFFACIHQNYVRAPAVMRARGKKRRVAKTRHFHTSYKNALDALAVIIFHYPPCPCAKRCRVCYFRLPNSAFQMSSGIYGREN